LPPGAGAQPLPRPAATAASTDRRRGDLDPAVVLARGVQGQRVTRRALDRLTGLEVEHALALGARDLCGPVVERSLAELAAVPGARLGECEQPALVVCDRNACGGQIERADLTLGDLRQRADAEILGAHAPLTARNDRCSTV